MSSHRRGRLFLLMLAQGLLAIAARGDEPAAPTPEQLDFFEKKIRPVLVEHCHSCHSADAKILRGGLYVDSRDGLLRGGDSGPALVPGDAEESLLLSAMKYDSYEMPPKEKLPAAVIADFQKWIEMGAPDPRTGETGPAHPAGIDLAAGREFWAFRPLRDVPAPDPADFAWPRSDIDRFVRLEQERAGLAPTTDADRLTLLRRLSFDLIGLPPTVEEVREFLQDPSPDAVERLVDRLLQSPHFGERWGRHWLDLARYADSTGGGRSMLYGESWRFRDYVINAFNRDKRYDEFLIEQLAGDLLPADSDLETRRERLIATGFLALGPSNYEEQDKEQLRMDVVDEQIDTVGKVFLAMTLGCARCHDHKFDPIPTSDYYALAGIFRNTQTLVHANVSNWVTTPLPLPDEDQQKYDRLAGPIGQLEQQLTKVGRSVKQLETQLAALSVVVDDDDAELFGKWTPSVYHKHFVGRGYRHTSEPQSRAVFSATLKPGKYAVQFAYNASGSRTPALKIKIHHADGSSVVALDQQQPPPIDGLYRELGAFEFGETGRVVVQPTDERHTIIDGVRFLAVNDESEEFTALSERLDAARARQRKLTKELADLKKDLPEVPPLVVSVREEGEIADYRIGIRGSVKNLGDVVPRGFLTVASIQPHDPLPAGESGRRELAEWIADADNPLTARVFVNRVWARLFDHGLVRTVDNFGEPGERPSHPELLDFLASEFIRDGWSVKRLIRRIVLSRTYQLASDGASSNVDPENRLLTRQNRKRLDAEAIHDALLLVGGELSRTVGGPSVRPDTTDEYTYQFDYGRRAVYLPVLRNRLPEIFAAFDFPDPNLSQGSRTSSTLPTQALFLLNSPFVQDRASATAERVLSLPLADDDARLDWLTLSLFGRLPTSDERRLISEFLARGDSPAADRWSRAAQTLIGSIAFRYLN